MDEHFLIPQVHRVRFTEDVFAPPNPVLADVLRPATSSTGRCIAFIDAGVAAAWPALPDAIRSYADAHDDVLELAAPPQVVIGGEASKNDRRVVDAVTDGIDRAGICRHSWVFAIGGGAMLDAVGFGAAIAHRGIRLVRFPTTTLAQDDAGIGVKNGINAFGKKNFLGTFAVPWAVLNDTRFLTTLDDRDWRAGLSEAVKVALLKDPAFFEMVETAAPSLARRVERAVHPIIRRCARLHLEHITRGGDPFEVLAARPLDFGHWSAHKIEQLTGFTVRHGEAVAIGIALDTMYSVVIGALGAVEGQRVLACLRTLGFDLYDPVLEKQEALFAGLDEFREHLGGHLCITLLRGIGDPFDAHQIDREAMVEAIRRLRPDGVRARSSA